MLKQKSRVYQSYPDIVGEKDFPLKDVTTEPSKKQPEKKPVLTISFLCAKGPVSLSQLTFLVVIMTILSLVTFVILPILSVVLTDVSYRPIFWFPAYFMLTIWGWIISSNQFEYLCLYVICYCIPMGLFYLFGSFQSAGIIDWSWIRICVPLYPMVVLVPSSFLIRKHLRKLTMIGT